MAEDKNYIKGSSNGPSRTDKILIETLEDFASYSKIPFSEPIEILKQNQQGVKMTKELGYTEDGLLYLYNSIDSKYKYVDPNDIKKLELFLRENDLIDFLYTNQLYVPFQIDVDKEILTKEEILKLPDIPVNHITEGQGIIRNLKEKYLDELIDLDVDFDNVDGGRINIQSLFIDSDLKEKEIYEDIANELNQLSNKYNVSINNYDDNPIHNFYNIIDTPTNVVDDLITKNDLSEAIQAIEGRYQALGDKTHGRYVQLLLDELKAKGFDVDNPDNIKRLDNFVLSQEFSDITTLDELVMSDDMGRLQGTFLDDISNLDDNLQIIDTPTNVIPESPIVFAPDITGEAYDEIEDLLLVLRDKYADVLDIGQDGDPALYFDIQRRSTEEMQGVHINFELIQVSQEHRNKGIGTEILNEVKKIATKHKIPISASAVDRRPTGFFAKQGFLQGEDMVWIPESIDPKYIVEKSGGSIGAAKLNDPLVFDSWVDNLGRTTTSFVDNLPLETVVKNRVKNLIATKTKQLAKPGSLIVKAVDAWEFGVIGLMAAGIAFNEIDEVPTIINNTAINMFNSMTAPYGIAPVEKEEYDIDYEFINTVLNTGSKVMPTDIIIEKLKPYSLEEGEDVILPGTGVTATTGAKQQFEPYGEELAKRAEKTVNMKRDEVKQKILESKGVQEEKMFEQAKPKKSSGGGSGAKIL